MKRIVLTFFLLAFLCSGTRAAQEPLPPEILNNTSAMVLYFGGRADARAQVNAILELGEPQMYSFRSVAAFNRSQLGALGDLSIILCAYLLGRINEFEAAADDAGEP